MKPWLVATLAVGIYLGVYFLQTIGFSGDAGWHLANGIWILRHHLIPLHNYLTTGGYGRSWSDPEWLWDVFLAVAYRLGGYHGVFLASSLVLAVAVYGLVLILHRRRLSPAWAALLLTVGVVAMAPIFRPRPQIASLAFFIWALYTILEYRVGRTRLLWVMVAATPVWANAHASVVLWPALLAGEIVLGKRKDRRLALALLVSIALMLVHPGGPFLWLRFFAKNSVGTNLTNIEEWGSPNFHDLLFLLGLMLLAWAVAWPKLKNPAERAWMVALTAAMLYSSRMLIYAVPIYVVLLAETVPEEAYRHKAFSSWIGVSAAIAGTAVLAITLAKPYPSTYPVKAVRWLKTHGQGGRILNYYSYGGDLESVGVTPWQDGRDNIWEMLPWWQPYLQMGRGEMPVAQFLHRYGPFRYVIWPKNRVVDWELQQMPGWRWASSDENAEVWVSSGTGRVSADHSVSVKTRAIREQKR